MKWKQWSEFARDESNWRNSQEKGLLKAEYLEDYVLRLWFEEDMDVSIYDLDLAPLIAEEYPGEVLLPLRDRERFRNVRGDYTLIWLNPETDEYDEKAVDIAPECIRYFCENYGRKIKAPQKKAA